MRNLLILIICGLSFVANAIPFPKDNKATFDIIRKNKIIGTAETIFIQNKEYLEISTIVNIEVKLLFLSAYKFNQISKEIWLDNEFISFSGETDFEDDRKYIINGKDNGNNFVASGMDGELILNKSILPLNYWNKSILTEETVFDMQKGIERKIKVKKLHNEIIEIGKFKIETEKYLFNASTNAKDLGPFPEYTLWYANNGELVKFKFTNWKDKKDVITQRNDWGE